MYYVYVLQSQDSDRKLYIGYTGDLERRFSEHNSPTNQGWTKNRKWTLVYYEAYKSEPDARQRENRLKSDGRCKRHLLDRIKSSLVVD